MLDPGTEALVLLHLADETAAGAADPVTAATVAEALVPDETLSDRFELVDALASLEAAGDLAATTVPDDCGGTRPAYRLTPAGRERAAAVRERLADVPIRVHEADGTRTVAVSDLATVLPDVSLGWALARADEGELFVPGGLDTGTVGREDVLRRLEATLETAAAGRARTVLIAGGAWTGKSTVLRATVRRARERGVETVLGRCGADGGPGEPLAGALSDLLADGPRPGADEVPAAPADSRTAFFSAVATAVAERTAEGPLLVGLEDLHLADPATLDLFTHVAAAVDDAPLVLVGTYRPGELPHGGAFPESLAQRLPGDRLRSVTLEPFDDAETRAVCERTLRTASVPEDFVALLQEATGGIPFFVTACLETLCEEGSVDPAADRYPVSDPLPVPDRVRTTVERRLGALDDVQRDVLERAAVLGASLRERVLVSVCDRGEGTVRGAIGELLEAGLLERVADDRLRFPSTVVSDVLSAAVDTDRERLVHARTAETLIAHDADERDDARIATHLEAADRRERALEFYRRAGDRAADRHDTATAIEHYESALALARDLHRGDDRAAMLERLARAAYLSGDLETSECHLEELRACTDDRRLLRRAALFRSRIEADRGDVAAAKAAAKEGLDRDGPTNTPAYCELLSQWGWLHLRTGDPGEAQRIFETERDLARRLGGADPEAMALHDLGSVALQRGDVAEARETLERAVRRRAAVGDRRGLATTLNALGATALTDGDLARAREAAERSRETFADVGDEAGELAALVNGGVIAERSGDWDRALERYREGLDRARRLSDRQTRCAVRANVGAIELSQGRLDAARSDLERATDLARELDDCAQLAMVTPILARLDALEGRLGTARLRLDRARQIAIGVEDVETIARVAAIRGAAERDAGRDAAAVEHFEAALDRATTAGSTELAIDVRCGLALAAAGTGDGSAALAEATTAVEAAQDFACPHSLARSHLALARAHATDGNPDAASAALTGALETARSLGARLMTCRALATRARLAADDGRMADAREDREAALSIVAETGATVLTDRCELALPERA